MTHHECQSGCNTFIQIWVAIVLMAHGTFAAQLPDDLKEAPKRIVNGTTVDLQPLVNWHLGGLQGPRPMAHWIAIDANIVETHPYGWVILQNGKSYILKNPPKEKLAEHQRLSIELRALETRQQKLQANLDAESRLRTNLDRQQASTIEAGSLDDQTLGRSLASHYRLSALRTELALIERKIAELKKHPLKPQEPYRVRCFVFNTKQQLSGREILDRGFPMR